MMLTSSEYRSDNESLFEKIQALYDRYYKPDIPYTYGKFDYTAAPGYGYSDVERYEFKGNLKTRCWRRATGLCSTIHIFCILQRSVEKDGMTVEIKTERLILRPVCIGDEKEIHEYAGEKEITMMFWLPRDDL